MVNGMSKGHVMGKTGSAHCRSFNPHVINHSSRRLTTRRGFFIVNDISGFLLRVNLRR